MISILRLRPLPSKLRSGEVEDDAGPKAPPVKPAGHAAVFAVLLPFGRKW